MIEQYLSNTNESATVRKILTSHNLNKAVIKEKKAHTRGRSPLHMFHPSMYPISLRVVPNIRVLLLVTEM
jgi:hypothetical protein